MSALATDREAASKLVPALQRFSTAAAITCSFVGTLLLIGWAFNIPTLKSVSPQLVSMKPNAAFCIVLIGIALWLRQERREPGSQPRRGLAQAAAAAAAFLALLTLNEHAFG